jgi:hypothetical protein
MIIGKKILRHDPKWTISGTIMENSDGLPILGVAFEKFSSGFRQAENRVRSCRNAYYSPSGCGLSYPGLSPEAKVELWRSVLCSFSLLRFKVVVML